jgi:predicted DNA-binding transcriptional regulator AlpA
METEPLVEQSTPLAQLLAEKHGLAQLTARERLLLARLLVGYDDLKSLGIRFHRAWLNRLIAQGKFPESVQTGEHSRAWRMSDILDWIDNLPPMPSATWLWITDGEVNKRLEKSEPVPRGWRIGRIAVNKKENEETRDSGRPRAVKLTRQAK